MRCPRRCLPSLSLAFFCHPRDDAAQALDFVPIPGRMRLRVSNDLMGPSFGLGEHRLHAAKWGIEDL